MKVAFVTSEVAPFSKSGGLADVSGALPGALRKLGVDVQTITPLYPSARGHSREAVPIEIKIPMKGEVLSPRISRSGDTWFVEYDPYFDREGLYGDSGGAYPDNASRFAFFCRVVLSFLEKTGPFDLIHAHDWQAGLLPVYARKAKTLFTIHNLAYQGTFGPEQYGVTGLDWKHYRWQALEYHGNWSFLKGGLVYSDAVTTVSPTYAEEIQTDEFGMGLQGVLQERSNQLHGILNGIDLSEWDPEQDPLLPAAYSAGDLSGKWICKESLQQECQLPRKRETPVIGMVTRLVEQKGLDLLISSMKELMKEDLQLVILGSGEVRFQEVLAEASKLYPEKCFVRIGFNNGLAHRIEAGADMFLMPSRFEPCGLNQMYSLRYGTVPIVRKVGGLSDTVVDGVTGIQFSEYSGAVMMAAVRRALHLYRNGEAWSKLISEGMGRDFSWDRSAMEYLRLYEDLLREEG